MGIATDSTISARARVEAWSTIRGLAECKAQLLDLDPPSKHPLDATRAGESWVLGWYWERITGPGPQDHLWVCTRNVSTQIHRHDQILSNLSKLPV